MSRMTLAEFKKLVKKHKTVRSALETEVSETVITDGSENLNGAIALHQEHNGEALCRETEIQEYLEEK